ncbi:helix-hairpin-helix domain-containing protein [Paenibacillus algorifonticola]|uniref:helix-hairpin-helix domain-containing protein n=1 Tax=Paenibacillus algorifonticola TaxID=684063 RepID=UPI003D2CEFA7
MREININHLIDICAGYSGAKYYVAEMVPTKKLKNARIHFPIPANEYVIALMDTTVFGSCKRGMAIGLNGVYWRNDWTVKSHRSSLSWMEFLHARIKKISKYEMEFGRGDIYSVLGEAIKLDDLIQLLQRLQSYIGREADPSLLTGSEVSSSLLSDPGEVWMVGAAGEQYGPYSAFALKNIIEEKQLQLTETFVWKPGMAQWVPLLKNKELIPLFMPALVAPMPITVSQAPTLDLDAEVDKVLDADALLGGNESSERIDINRASMEQLLDLPAIGVVGAKRIMQERERNGGFENVEQLGQLLDLKPHHVERIRPMIIFCPLQQRTSTGRIVDY